ncbi:hypothetical protein [Microcoleus sp. Pol10D4]|uniref:hypothetical protein n=1 Tax=Microcoleus sp. Pol10D4 TaxID=3055387 RepID=UPI002FD5A913
MKEEASISMKAAQLEIGVRSQDLGARRKESEGRRKKEGARSQKKCFYKYEMLPTRRDRGRFRIIDDVGRSPICKLACYRLIYL